MIQRKSMCFSPHFPSAMCAFERKMSNQCEWIARVGSIISIFHDMRWIRVSIRDWKVGWKNQEMYIKCTTCSMLLWYSGCTIRKKTLTWYCISGHPCFHPAPIMFFKNQWKQNLEKNNSIYIWKIVEIVPIIPVTKHLIDVIVINDLRVTWPAYKSGVFNWMVSFHRSYFNLSF